MVDVIERTSDGRFLVQLGLLAIDEGVDAAEMIELLRERQGSMLLSYGGAWFAVVSADELPRYRRIAQRVFDVLDGDPA